MQNKFSDYQKSVKEILSLYNAIRSDLKIQDPAQSETIKRTAAPFVDGCFTLAVIGKMSAGKSTFINALLGDDQILATGIFQTTCIITEIHHSIDKKIIVTFANNSKETIRVKSLGEELRKYTAIPDEYSKLPVNLINKYITQDKSKEEILNNCENIQNESKTKFDIKDLGDYLEKKSKENIPTKIEVYYPLPDEFEGWRIIDTPGVEAIGGIEDATKEFLTSKNKYGNNNVDAIVFLHSGKDNIEDKAFNSFVESTLSSLTNETKKRTFLVLTHAADNVFLQNKEVILKKAHEIFESDENILSNRILAIDSYLELSCQKLISQRVDLMSAYDNDCIDDITSSIIHNSVRSLKRRQIEVNSETLNSELFEVAGFKKLYSILNNFVASQKEDVYSFLSKKVKEDIVSFLKKREEDVKIFKEKLTKSSDEFAAFIKDKMNELDLLQVEFNQKVNILDIRYDKKNINNAVWSDKEQLQNLKGNNKQDLENEIKNCISNVNELLETRRDALLREYSESISKINSDIQVSQNNIYIPRIDSQNITSQFLKKKDKEKVYKLRYKLISLNLGNTFNRFWNDTKKRDNDIRLAEIKSKLDESIEERNKRILDEILIPTLKESRKKIVGQIEEIKEQVSRQIADSMKEKIDSYKREINNLKQKDESERQIRISIKQIEKEIEQLEVVLNLIKTKSYVAE